MNDRLFTISDHALKRMESRNISRVKLAQVIFRGKQFACSNGRYKSKLWERTGNNLICYHAVFAKQTQTVVTVWTTESHIKQRKAENNKVYRPLKAYKHRKRTLLEMEFDSYCREEYNNYNLSFSA